MMPTVLLDITHCYMFHNREFTLVQINHVLSVSGGKSSIVLRMLHHVRLICSMMCGNVL